MKKNKITKIVAIVLIFVLALVPYINVFANNSITITKKSYIKVSQDENDNRRESKYVTSKGIAYCITPTRPGAPEGTTLSYVGEEKNGGLLYLLEHDVEGNEFEYLATQLAIWEYATDYLPEYYTKHADAAVVQRAKELKRDAVVNSDYSIPASSVELTYDGAKFTALNSTLIADKQPLKSGIITAKIVNGQSTSIKLSKAPEGTKVYDANSGKELSSIENGTEFYIVIPRRALENGRVNFTVEVHAEGIAKRVERYSTGDGNLQDLIVINTTKTEDTDGLNFSVNITEEVKNKCEYIDGKYYDENGDEIDHATYLTTCETHKCEKVDEFYFDEDGKITDEETYDKQCFKHTCEKIGNTYYDSLGVITSYEEYKSQCEAVQCEIVNGKYYGNEGDIVSLQEFRNQCEAQIVPVPDTASSSIISIIIGSLMLVVAGSCVLKYRKNN